MLDAESEQESTSRRGVSPTPSGPGALQTSPTASEKEKAKKELEDWYKKYEEQLGKTKDDNRYSEIRLL